MEVGAVKQAFNNEVIQMKKKLNQAKIQIIHKLTRKAKTLVEKKSPEPLKEKFKRKAEAAVNEVLIIKKLTAKVIAKFAVIHKGNLGDYLNKPKVDQDKACARLLLHKALRDKYEIFKTRFANMPIEDLMMSRLERKKLKKEQREKQKKKKGNDKKVTNSEGNWEVSDVHMVKDKLNEHQESTDGENVKIMISDGENEEFESDGNHLSDGENQEPVFNEDHLSEVKSEGFESETKASQSLKLKEELLIKKRLTKSSDPESEVEDDNSEDVGKFVKLVSRKRKQNKTDSSSLTTIPEGIDNELEIRLQRNKTSITKLDKTIKNSNKSTRHKNLNDKILLRKFKKSEEVPVQEFKVADPFFITASGESYMSVVEPRQPDEVKEVHRQGNRKLRRAVMFGHVPKTKLRQNNFKSNDKFDRQSGFHRNESIFKNKHNNRQEIFNRGTDFKGKSDYKSKINDYEQPKTEKLHPSWEAKKKQSTILPFQGKKVIFDDG